MRNHEVMEYGIMSGKADGQSLDDMTRFEHDYITRHRRVCCQVNCAGELYFDGIVDLRPGRKDEKSVNVYRCFCCNSAEMEDHT